MTGDAWALLFLLTLGGGLYWVWHAWRWRKIGCARCGGSGSLRSKSLMLGHPVQRPCPRCKRRGKEPWRRRKFAPEPKK